MITRNILKLALVLLTSTSLFACGGKKNDPVLSPQGEEKEKLQIMDLKAEIEVAASKEITFSIIANKGFDPNIYRDGKIVSQANYESGDENITNIKTTLRHKGKALSLAFSFRKTSGDDSKEPIQVKIKAKLYKNDKLIQEYETTKSITPQNDYLTEEFQLWGNP